MFACLKELYLHLNDGDVSAAVFFDLTKVIDCVNHSILLRKLGITDLGELFWSGSVAT